MGSCTIGHTVRLVEHTAQAHDLIEALGNAGRRCVWLCSGQTKKVEE